MPKSTHFADGPASILPRPGRARGELRDHVKMTSDAEDFIDIMRSSIKSRLSLSPRAATEEITRGLIYCFENHREAFDFACREMGIPNTIEAVATLSTEAS